MIACRRSAVSGFGFPEAWEIVPAPTEPCLVTVGERSSHDAAMDTLSRTGAVAWIGGGTAWAATALFGLRAADGSVGFFVAETSWLIVHAFVLVGIVALLRSRATGRARWGQAGLALAAIARLLFMCLEVAAIIEGDDDVALFPLAVIGTGIGMLVGGLAILLSGEWTGWARFAPLAVGAYPLLAIVPVFAATGDRPPDVLIAGWGLAIAAVGLAFITQPTTSEVRPRSDRRLLATDGGNHRT